MLNKYRIHELAKDFDVKSTEVIELLSKYYTEPMKHQTLLDEEMLDIIFETFTLEHEVENFDEYFATAALPKPEREKKPDAAPEPAEPAKPQPAAGAKPGAAKAPARPADRTAVKRPGVISQPAKPSQPFQRRQKPAGSGPVQPQARTKGEVRTIDTRAGHVELDKYNERYENIAPVNKSPQSDTSVNKQKLKQKSQQYRRQGGMRTSRKETEAERLKRIAAERAKKPQMVITVPDEITVGELAAMLKMTAAEVIKKLFLLGVKASVNEIIDYDTAEIVATELGAKVRKQVIVTIEDRIIDDSVDDEASLLPRDPVVVVMGHVDHGKTSILDAIRNTAVIETEAGGITQHIGAYRAKINDKLITFLDTPGHAAFTSMRARGAQATDIAILVVAADDGIMPQTVEAINHATAANVPIVVAINKMDKPGASPDRIMQQLTEYNLVPEEWGGETICVPVSAVTKMNLDKLLESVLLVAELRELKANPNRAARGVVIEARVDKGQGPIATLLVQNGTLHSGDAIIAGSTVGRIRVMTDDKGNKAESAGPSVPVEVTGLDEAPQAGDSFYVVSDEKLARELVEQRKHEAKQEQFKSVERATLENLFATIEEGKLKELAIIVKADVQGSAEAIKQNLEKLSNNEVRVKVLHNGVGAVSESDVMLASASNAIIVGFNVRPDPVAQANAERDGVEIRLYRIIYDCIEEVEAAMKGMLAPKHREVQLGRIEVRQVVKITAVGNVAGCHVLTGKVVRGAKIRVVRDGIVVAEDDIASLRRFKDDVKEVASGFDCGIALEKFSDIKEGDIFEAFVIEEYRD
ncbi:MAG TPA: translation initiation factor IF-2 [Clostridiales bacterium]|nr:MAG: Translation initiation factor IF-2 [Firmicutes bacterium ADurb.Bin262]HOU10417.1 translation initiation factor IF-2 [Clostridiales bacterium]HQH62476.1 translation initiation factor IF-2 [Clostridiales bacterium]HQK73611.1 translation initiation factor IF-2 [Clostridiales bacterium]